MGYALNSFYVIQKMLLIVTLPFLSSKLIHQPIEQPWKPSSTYSFSNEFMTDLQPRPSIP